MCNGVVLIGDRKLTLQGGADLDYEDKVFMDIINVVIGSSGVLGLFDKFRERIRSYISLHPTANIDDFITEIENQTKILNDTYRDRLANQVFDV